MRFADSFSSFSHPLFFQRHGIRELLKTAKLALNDGRKYMSQSQDPDAFKGFQSRLQMSHQRMDAAEAGLKPFEPDTHVSKQVSEAAKTALANRLAASDSRLNETRKKLADMRHSLEQEMKDVKGARRIEALDQLEVAEARLAQAEEMSRAMKEKLASSDVSLLLSADSFENPHFTFGFLRRVWMKNKRPH